MTGTDLVPAGQTVRVVPSEIGPVIPVVDIAELIGYSRSSITKTIGVYARELSPFQTFKSLPTSGGPQQFLCLNRIGVDRFFLLIHPAKRRETFGKLLEFREKILAKMDAGKPPEPAPPIDEELVRAKYLADLAGGNLASFQAIAFKKCGLEEYIPALNVPQVIHGEVGIWLNATQIGARCGHSAREVNHFLEWHRFQYNLSGIWRLTDKGELHAEEYWIETTSRHREIRIRWRESILVVSGLVREQPGQTALAARV
jgi:hypothetical protein